MGRIRPSSLLTSLILLALAAPAATAQWAPDGAPVTLATGNQWQPAVVADGACGALFLWRDPRGGTHNLYMQRLDADGVRRWDAADLPVRVLGGATRADAPHLAPGGAGGALVAWQDDRPGATGVYIQHVEAAGVVRWTVNGLRTGLAAAPRILADGAGGSYLAGTDAGVAVVQRFDADGAAVWSGDHVALDNDGDTVRLVRDGAGGVVLGWRNTSFANDAVFGMRLDGSATEMWPSHWVGPSGTPCAFAADPVADGAGGTYFVWEQGDDVRAQRMDAAGARQWYADGLPVNQAWPDVFSDPQAVPDGAGGLLVAYRQSSAFFWLARLTSGGTVLWREPVYEGVSVPGAFTVAGDGMGGAFVAWEDNRNAVNEGTNIYAQHLDGDGARTWALDGTPVCTQDRDQQAPRLAATGPGRAVVVWEDPRISDLQVDIWAQVLHVDGSIGDPPFELASHAPAAAGLDVPADAHVAATFSSEVDPLSLAASTVTADGALAGPLAGTFVAAGTGAEFVPSQPLLPGERVTVVLTTGVGSKAGKPLAAPASWTFTAEAGGSHGGFLAPRAFGVDTSPYAVCPADLDGDGDLDLVVASYGDDTVAWLEGTGSGLFLRPPTWATGTRPHGVAVGDLDRDGDQDVVTADYGSARVSVFENLGGGSLQAAVPHATGAGPESVCVADLDGDGWPDLATANLTADNVSVLLNDGAGGFAAHVDHPGADNPFFIRAGDLDGDGDMDLVTANLLSDDVSVFLNDGAGGLAPRTDFPAGDGANTVHPADLDGDGDLDLVVGAGSAGQVLVLRNRGDATFDPPVAYPAGTGPYAGLPVDVDGDGDLDLVACRRSGDDVAVRFNDGSGGFGPETAYPAGDGPVAVVAGDFDGDGALDLVTADENGDTVSLLRNDEALSGAGAPAAAAALRPNVPNPFNPGTRIDFTVPRAGHVRLAVYDARGREVAVLVDGHREARDHTARWDGRDAAGRPAASGVYFYRLTAGGLAQTRKMVLVR